MTVRRRAADRTDQTTYDRAVSSGYPAHREADVVLRDGSTVRLRPVRPEDEGALAEFFGGLSLESQAFRFFSGAVDLEQVARLMAEVDYTDRYGILATRGDDDRPVGHGVYIEMGGGQAEVAFAVIEDMQALGLGTILLAHLAEAAAENDIPTFVAEVLPQNHKMIEVFRDSGFLVESKSVPGGIRIALPTSLSQEALKRFEDRDRLAAEAAVRHFLEPRSVAVVGASRRRGTVGGEVLHNMVVSGYPGGLYAVNPAAETVQEVPAFPSIAAIPAEIDLAVIAIPAEGVVDVARKCAEKGVRGLLVLSAGFAETGKRGAKRERDLLGVCRDAGCGWSDRTAWGCSTPRRSRASTPASHRTPRPPGASASSPRAVPSAWL